MTVRSLRPLLLLSVAFSSLLLATAAVAQSPAAVQEADRPPEGPTGDEPSPDAPLPGPELRDEASGQPPGAPTTEEQVDELRRQVQILAEEVEKLRAGEPEAAPLTDQQHRALGLAPSAAATYRRTSQGVSLAGYGEMLLENYAGEGESGAGGAPATRLDFLRAILYAGYRFNDRFLFNSEIEVEHAGEISVEFAYIDYRVRDDLTLRGGMLLLPLGLVNEFHEPTVFIGARRPETEQRILPSTWRENGAGVLGSVGRVDYRVYLVNGLNASGFSSAGLRGGRQKGMQARAANMAVAARVDVTPIPGVFAGVGFYEGGSGQDAVVAGGEQLDIGNTVGEVHAQAQLRGFDFRALYARAAVDDAGALSGALGLAADAPVAERMEGGYLQAGYDVLSQTASPVSLMPYVRLEHVDTQDRVPAGFTRDLSKDGSYTTIGVEVKPVPGIALKTEHQWIRNEAGTGRNQFNINLGYAF